MSTPLEDILPSFALDSYLLHRKVRTDESELPDPPSYNKADAQDEAPDSHNPDYTRSVFQDLNGVKKKKMAVSIGVVLCKDPPKLRISSKPEDPCRVYFPGDLVTGQIIVTNVSRICIPFKAFLVSLEGTAKTSKGNHHILRSVDVAASSHPGQIPLRVTGHAEWGDSDSDGALYGFPPNKILKPGTTYKTFFHFVVPHCLLDTVCPHQLARHLVLPPTTKDTAPEGFGAVSYCVKGRLVGQNHKNGIYYREGKIAVTIGTNHPVVPAISTSHQLDNIRRRMDRAEEKEYEEDSCFSVYVSAGVPHRDFSRVLETLSIEARSSPHRYIHLTLSTEMSIPPSSLMVNPELRVVHITSPSPLPLSIDGASLVHQIFVSNKWFQFRSRCRKESRHASAMFYDDLRAISRMTCNEHELMSACKLPKVYQLVWKSQHSELSFPLELDCPLEPSFQSCYLARFYVVVLKIHMRGIVAQVTLPLSV